ncbi:hypothetical protein [Flavobacterium sp. ov086]|uniref:hypothetical protein n=1 Tax=Flavobacterium sp. ov086 TaxID=1761785 RepID=UPI000B63AF61|nr:hypothetical protein [Flavobacterium sp. ov086]SNR35051.1 hypothetical protein SAMN04487979_103346 [Flavobacterium sp. ov086]
MKQIYQRTIIILLFITFQSYSQTQEAIIFFKDGDSIEGLAALKFNKIKFKISPDDKTDTWDYEYVKKITFIGFEMRRTFEYVTLNSLDKPKLVETITKGEVSLYKKLGSDYSLFDLISNPYDELPSNNPNINSQLNSQFNSQFPGQYPQAREVPEFYYLKKEKDKYPTCLNCGVISTWRKNTSKFFADCDFIVKNLKGDKWVFEDLREIVEFYNDICLGE